MVPSRTRDLMFLFLMIPRPPISTLFPYTTLFRSVVVPLEYLLAEEHWRQELVGRMLPSHLLSLRVNADQDRKSTRLNSSHVAISYAVFCLKKKNGTTTRITNTTTR